MVHETASQTYSLEVKRTFSAPREKVWEAWTTPEALKRWFCPSDEFSTPVADVDLRVGGAFRFQMRSPEGKTHTAVGIYREVQPPEKLVFTWSWEENDLPETLLTLEFRDLGEEAELVLTHELFPSEHDRDEHRKGWTECLGNLERKL